MMRQAAMVTLGAGVFASVLCVDDVTPSGSGWFARADAVIGRPLTPMSYAGVARRTSRRAAYRAGAYGYGGYGYAAPAYAAPAYAAPAYAAPYPPPYAAPCNPLYDAYGRLVQSC